MAGWEQHVSVVALLLLNGADTTIKNSYNLTPREEARGTVRYLRFLDSLPQAVFLFLLLEVEGAQGILKAHPHLLPVMATLRPLDFRVYPKS